MDFSFDHLVHMTKRPEEAVESWKQMGFHALNGGHHETWGTYNGILHFGLPYIEFLGIENINKAKTVSNNTLITQTAGMGKDYEGFLRLAIRTQNMSQAVNHFKQLGLSVLGPVPGERRREDGTLLKWEMLFIEEKGADPYNYPFIIDWKMSDSDREASLTKQGLIIQAEDNPALTEIGIFTETPIQTALKWERLFKLAITSKSENQVKGTLGSVEFNFYSDYDLAKEYKGKNRPTYVKITGSPVNGLNESFGGHYQFIGG